ncbi:hypothetical protein PPERSA_05074 [Pseudocohnilembus persalinus]|uniref:Proteasome subunit beta n=1 Tax=Pseudocohnilembus persalinus TaxID=266149 RepID=A0A0V0QWL0_PSEPJ|nr:hypothetical protein PPERSA_05074 [Pseudocohnilembus persalinus]|eukprot:KRX06461.1 hypothetical protein PPERSA_05074 [Pseudocohnilembus persalinus]
MDSSFGVVGKDFVIVATDSSVLRSIMKLHEDEDKTKKLTNTQILAISGEASDRLQFGDYVEKNLKFFKYRNGITLSNQETANFIRNTLATALRKGPYQVNCLFAGYDSEGPALYSIDYLGTMFKTHSGASGYASYFTLGLLDNYYKKDLTLEEGKQIIQHCANELKSRFIVNQPNFKVKVITKEGIEEYEVEAKKQQ